jgi:hypothetical protein
MLTNLIIDYIYVTVCRCRICWTPRNYVACTLAAVPSVLSLRFVRTVACEPVIGLQRGDVPEVFHPYCDIWQHVLALGAQPHLLVTDISVLCSCYDLMLWHDYARCFIVCMYASNDVQGLCMVTQQYIVI